MKLVKDILYDKNNDYLDIARLCAVLGVIGFIAMSGYGIYQSKVFDALAWGTGWAAICGGNAAWIYARQKYEKDDKHGSSRPRVP